MADNTSQDDFDTPWKDAVEHAFPEFIDFYFPDASRQIDWARGYTFLDKELQQIARDAELGRRYVDKLVSVSTHSGEEDWLCVHIEVQGKVDHGFERRMFVYNYRIFDTYDRPVASLAVLADEDPAWRPAHFGYERLGCRHSLHFPVAKLLDYMEDEAALLDNPNPFALVTAAHLYTRRTRKDPARRFDAKRRLVRLLYERDWSRQRILDFFAVLDWMMKLPRDLDRQLWQDIENIEGERKVRYVTSIERIAIEQGMEKGIAQGMEKGIEKGIRVGREQGRQEGRQEGRREGQLEAFTSLLLYQLNLRFGPLSTDVADRIAQATPEQIKIWAGRLLSARTLDDVFADN